MKAVSAELALPDAVQRALAAGADVALWTSGDPVTPVLDGLERALASGALDPKANDTAVARALAREGRLRGADALAEVRAPLTLSQAAQLRPELRPGRAGVAGHPHGHALLVVVQPDAVVDARGLLDPPEPGLQLLRRYPTTMTAVASAGGGPRSQYALWPLYAGPSAGR